MTRHGLESRSYVRANGQDKAPCAGCGLRCNQHTWGLQLAGKKGGCFLYLLTCSCSYNPFSNMYVLERRCAVKITSMAGKGTTVQGRWHVTKVPSCVLLQLGVHPQIPLTPFKFKCYVVMLETSKLKALTESPQRCLEFWKSNSGNIYNSIYCLSVTCRLQGHP